MKSDVVDERQVRFHRSVVKDFWTRAPASAKLVLLGAACIFLWFLKSQLANWNAGRRERLNHRRRAGIPDSDTRPFRVAFLDAEAKRREKESNQREQVMKQKDSSRRLLQPSATAPNLQSPSILQRESSMRNRNLGASPRAQSQLVDSSISPAGGSRSARRSSAYAPSQSPYAHRSSGLRNQINFDDREAERSRPQRKRQYEDSRDESELSDVIEEKKPRLGASSSNAASSDIRMQQANRGHRRKRSESEGEDGDDDDDQDAKRFRQGDTSDAGMQVDTSADRMTDNSEQADIQVDEQDATTIEHSYASSYQDRQKRERSSSVGSSAAATPARKQPRSASRAVSQSTPLADQSATLSPEVKARLASKSRQLKPGESWKDPSGVKLRINAQGVKEQLTAVKQRRPKYNMPKGSKHPSANIMEERIVDIWLDEAGYDEHKRKGLLASQTEEDIRAEQRKQERAAIIRSSSPAQEDDSEKSIFFARGTSPSVHTLGSPSRSLKRESIGNIELLPNGRVKLPRSRSQHLTPRRSLASLEQDITGGESSAAKKKKKQLDRERAASHSSALSSEVTAEAPTAPGDSASPAPAPAPAPSFSLQPAATPASTSAPAAASPAPAPTFAFGNTPTSSSADPKPSATAPVETQAASPSPFSFGAPTATSQPASTASASTSAPAPAPAASPSPFSFGKPEEKSASPVPPAAAPSPSPFSFGASSTSSPKPADAPKPSFSFGSAPATSVAPPAPAASRFGGAGSSQPAAPAASTPSFSFGSTSSAAPAAASSSSSAGTGFSFGGSSSTAPAASGSPAPSPASASFSFGAPSQGPADQSSSGFKFDMGGSGTSSGQTTPSRGFRAKSANPSRRRI